MTVAELMSLYQEVVSSNLLFLYDWECVLKKGPAQWCAALLISLAMLLRAK